MSRHNPPSAAPAAILEEAARPTPAGLADAMGHAGSDDTLAKLGEAVGELKAMAAQPMLQRALDAIHAEDPHAATDWVLKALEVDERSGVGWYLLGIARERVADYANSITAYESALKLLPDHAEVANDLGRLAFRMGMSPHAEKLFRHFLARHPEHPEGSNNLACALRDQQKHDEAIAVLKPALLRNPEMPMLWNTMGTIVSEQGDFGTARVFFEEALRLQPDFPKARYNLGNCLLMLDEPQAALAACSAAIEAVAAENERQMMRLSRSTILIAQGRIGEGWDEYEARLHPQFADVTYFLVERQRWEPGADLAGKHLLVVGEQGLGDEILFGTMLPDLLERVGPEGRISLAVERRLVALFQRRFPQVQVSAHKTYVLNTRPARVAPDVDLAGVDLWAPMASLLREFRRELSDFVARPVLAADPARVEHWKRELAALPGRKVGLLWKSAIKKDARKRHFAGFADWGPVLAQPGVSFVNLQYGDCAEELAFAKARFGAEIFSPPGVDLKLDLDEVGALACALDLTLGFSNASFNIAAGCGRPTWLISTPAAWPRLGCKDRYPWYPDVRVFAPERYGDWSAVMAEVGEALGGWAASER